jgi:carboxypeptidase Taq
MQPRAAYDKLVHCFRQRALLVSCLELLSWDELTYMPRGGVEHRGRQTAYLVGLLHDVTSDPRVGEWLETVEQSPLVADAGANEAVNVREWRRLFGRESRLPKALVQQLAEVTTTAQQRWAVARRNSDFRDFLPWLERVVALKREEARALGDGPPYDALLEDYEPGCSGRCLAELFAALRTELVPLLQAICGAQSTTHPGILRREFPIERQQVFGEAVAADIGFDFDGGRLDVTTHPFFSVVGPGDCRITTRYNQYDFAESFFAILHELGHALYEQGLDPRQYGTPCGDSSSLGIHESQSRIWENVVGRSREFWEHFFPRAREIFHDTLRDVSIDDFYRACNHVQPGWNRVRADEVTYDLHVMLRFELEQDLIGGQLEPADLPAAWQEKSLEYLGITPQNDAEGCLQDGHWAAGQFGYFPTYSLGNIYAAQLMARLRQDEPRLREHIAQGDFRPLHAWLQEHIFRHGQRFTAEQLIQRATGSASSHRPLIEYLWEKYGNLYDLSVSRSPPAEAT